ncbi:MAG: hypothetical protein HQ488_01480 [Parcubacteria group bacterium]|nr:hypothetical protein [Parcubacteria group bacterium]
MAEIRINQTRASELQQVFRYLDTTQGVQAINDYARRNRLSAVAAKAHFVAWIQFMVYKEVTGLRFSPSPVMDQVWHFMIVSTRAYREFCNHYFGRFVDHEPTEQPLSADYPAIRHGAWNFFNDIDEELWPSGDDSDADCG